ncbi:MAG TPA: SAM-dependent chlorinase/fluorinase [Acidobacteriaceae bacterium]|nr:SAM-dependent chlorinase/fluorinase [Acidobacteriaceae bacterium]
MMLRPLITLTTDFGLADPFVGVMKGVIASICPAAHVIDITHGVKAFDVLDGALAIWQSRRYFPSDTVHAIVVDPGVGSSRKPVLCRMGNAWFIAPDNGVLTLVERDVRRRGGAVSYRSIENRQYMLATQSNTFQGRDIFAPAAAHLAAQIERGNVQTESFGPEIKSLVQMDVPEPIHNPDGSIEGVILKSDRFGNLLTNVASQDLPADRANLSIELGSLRITRICRYYAEGAKGDLFGIVGSSGLLEIAVNQGSAQQEAGVQPGTKFRLVSK